MLPWPDDCYVQWGKSGLVLVQEGASYTTAFFEAFPLDSFIRGEGANVCEAEMNCWKQYQRILACPGHEFERRGYKNGAAFCKHCNRFKSGVFPAEE